jgi:hypothetical protein
MDGALLVLDSRTLPHLHALQTVPATKTSTKRNRAVPAFATLILALVLGMVYYVSTQSKATQDTPQPSAATTSNQVPEVVNPTPAPEAQPPAEEPKPEPAKPVTASASTAVPVKKATARPAPTPAKSKSDEKKDDSKVGGFLKKTGRILKKPFKL